jgi:hypothetical protein
MKEVRVAICEMFGSPRYPRPRTRLSFEDRRVAYRTGIGDLTMNRLTTLLLAASLTSLPLLAAPALAQIAVESTATIDPGLAPSGVAIADFNGDGLLDAAATVDGPGDVRILLGDGLGGLAPSSSINLPQNSGAGDLVAADFDGNGTADLAIVLKNLSSIAILLNDGAANFTLSSTVATGEDGNGPQTGDLDADGDLDLVVANSEVDTVSILRNGGAADFSVIELAVGADPRGAAFGDFDGDGDLDVVWASHDDRIVGFERNDSGSFTPWTSMPVSNLMRTEQIACGDLNHDGRDDVAIAARGDLGSYPYTILATAKGFAAQTPFFVSGGGIIAIALGDLDCDGDLDAAFADDHGNGVLMAENDGMGVFSNAMTMPAGLAVVAVATGDLDANGASDVLVAGTDSNSLTAFLLACDQQGVPGDLDGDGVVGPADLASLLGSWGESGPSDLDGDGTTGPSDLAIMLGLWS